MVDKIRRVKSVGKRKVVLDEVFPVVSNPEDCVVSVYVTAVCSTDAKAFTGQKTRLNLGNPAILGHEVCGHIKKSGASGLPKGTKVSIIGTQFCRNCNKCIQGKFLQCLNFQVSAGGFCDELIIPSEWCYWRIIELDKGVNEVVGAYLDSLACVYRAFKLANLIKGEKAIICGGGFMAILLARLVTSISEADVIVLADSLLSQESLDMFNIPHLSWKDALDSSFSDLFADVIFDLSGRIEAGILFNNLNYGGRCVIMSGNGQSSLPLTGSIYKKRISVTYSFHSDLIDRKDASAYLPTVCDIIELLSCEYPCELASEALSAVADHRYMRCHLNFKG